jgi:hypothetical protein
MSHDDVIRGSVLHSGFDGDLFAGGVGRKGDNGNASLLKEREEGNK